MTIRRAGHGASALLSILLSACGGGTTEPPSGSLALQVSGLPAGVEGSLTVVGPGGFNRSLGQSETLAALSPGSYTVTAVSVTAGGEQYLPSPSSQPVTVSAGETASAEVAYAVTERSLALTVTGLPAGLDAAITVSGPGGYSRPVTASETLTGLAPGQYTVTALPVSDGSQQYTPSPSARTVTVAGASAATVAYTTGGTAGFNLRVDGVYLVQSVQSYDRSVPLVRDRDALLRVFVTANQVNTAVPDVDVTLYASGVPVAELTIPAPGFATPLAPDEATLNSSWNVILDKSLIQSSLSIVATVDPGNSVAEGDETDNVFPASGTPLPLDVRTVPPFEVTLVPVITRANTRRGDVTDANRADYLETSMRIHPLVSWDATVHAAYTTTTSLALQSDNGNGAWGTILAEVNSLRLAESSMRHYYGVVNPNYSSGVAGIGYVGGDPAALGWDRPGSRGSVAAHEWGHNWGRPHAPCGGAANPDDNYPYANGEIGVIGYDLMNETLVPADAHDLMGYCSNEWISDYTYLAILSWRGNSSLSRGSGAAVQSGMLVWGRIENGRAVLEPAVRVAARPSLPARAGPYRLEGLADDGSRLFGLDFAATEVADDPGGGEHFAFVVPMRPERATRLASLQLAGPGTRASRKLGSEVPAVRVTRAGGGRIALHWDEARSPMLLVRDPVTGEVLSFARGGAAEVTTSRDEVVVTASGRALHPEQRVRVK